MRRLAAFLLLCGLGAGFGLAQPPGAALIFSDGVGGSYALADLRGKTVVLEWTNYDCVFVKKHYDSRRIQQLQATYTKKGVVWLSLMAAKPGAAGYLKVEQVAGRVEALGATPTAVVFDTDHAGVRAFGIDRSPGVVVLDTKGNVAYKGAVDSLRSWLPEDAGKGVDYIAGTLDALLANGAPPHTATRAYGCRH